MTQQYQEGITGFERFMEIMEVEPAAQDAPGARRAGAACAGKCQFQNVGFRYNENHYAYVLKNISLDVKGRRVYRPGGVFGVGKTTLCSLIPRFYEVSEGPCCWTASTSRISACAPAKERGRGAAGRVPVRRDGLENIRYGKPGASDAEIIAAAKKANAHEFIMRLPDGYDTDIGQRGVKLSGGQKQRLSIARVFLKDPPVLIFDEATSSLDNESEKVVQDSLELLAKTAPPL
jgi:ATP-binding cassette, subfamily B, bacterial